MKRIILCILLACSIQVVLAKSFTFNLYEAVDKGQGDDLGSILAVDTDWGLVLQPNLKGFAPGYHGFHIHVTPSCDNKGAAGSGRWDPIGVYQYQESKKMPPLGDLPVLYAGYDHVISDAVLAPKLRANDLIGHSVMITGHGDNYSDKPNAIGGSGVIVACAVVSSKTITTVTAKELKEKKEFRNNLMK